MSVTLDPSQVADLVTLKVDGPAILFIRVAPEKMSDEYVKSIIEAMTMTMNRMHAKGLKYLVVPKDIDLCLVGEGHLERLGLMRIPEAAP